MLPALHKTMAEKDGQDAVITRLNYGIIFKHVDTFDVCTDTWMQTFLIRMPVAWNITISRASVNCYRLQPVEKCQRVIHLVYYLYNSSAKAIDRLNQTLESVHKLISHFSVENISTSNSFRVEDGLLNFIGELSHSLFGTARDKDIAQLHAAMRHSAENQDIMTKTWRQSQNRLASLTETVNHRLEHMSNLLHIQRQTATELYRQIRAETFTLSKASFIIAMALVKFEDLVLLMDNLQSFYHGIQLLSNGILSPELISPGHFEHVLLQIYGRIKILTSGKLHMLRNKVTHYYRMHDFIANRQNDDLFIHILIPLGPLARTLTLYEIHSLSVPVPNLMHSKVATNLPNFIAYNPETKYFLEFQSRPSITMSKLLYLDQTHSVLQPVNKRSCVIALLRDNSSKIHKNCQFAVVTNSLQPEIFVLDSKHVLLTNISDAMLNCPDHETRNVSCIGFCKVTIPCRCSLTSDHFYIPARIEDCHADRTTDCSSYIESGIS